MEENLQISFRLLLIGMTTVCTILLLIVLSSKLLINILNKFSSELAEKVTNKNKIDPKVVAAINATVEVVTKGKGRVDSLKKL